MLRGVAMAKLGKVLVGMLERNEGEWPGTMTRAFVSGTPKGLNAVSWEGTGVRPGLVGRERYEVGCRWILCWPLRQQTR